MSYELTDEDGAFLIKVITDLWGIGLGFDEFTATTVEVLTTIPGLDRTCRARIARKLWTVYRGQGATKH